MKQATTIPNHFKTGRIYILTWLFTGLLLSISLRVHAQENNLDEIVNSFHHYTEKNVQEKIYLQTDKSFYTSGEILWFKLFVVDASFHKPISLSKVAYVEIYNSDLKPVLQGKTGLMNGRGDGSFFIPISLSSGNYKIRAYTNWMKNFSPGFFFEENITIINPLKSPGPKPVAKLPKPSIRFFPEGGNLVDGIPATVGFKVVDENGKGLDVSGIITDQDNKQVASFKSFKFGMGRFSFTPSSNNHYKAYAKISDNNLTVAELPAIYKEGWVLKVEDNGNDQLNASIISNIPSEKSWGYLIVHTRGIIKFAELVFLTNGKASVTIDKSKLGEGISCFTLIDHSKQPVCERLYFRQPSVLTVAAHTDQSEYRTRKKVKLDIELPDRITDSVKSDLCLSVYRVDSLQYPTGRDINSYLWLSSDIPGNIESPEYYFGEPDQELAEATDNLMLTQGWRRFIWDDALQNKTPAFDYIPEYAGHIITGKITDKNSGQPARDISTYASASGLKYQLGCSVSNSQGELKYDLENFYGFNELVVQTENAADSGYRINILNPFSEKFSDRLFPPFEFPEYKKDILAHSIGTQVQNAFLIDSLIKFKPWKNPDSTSFYGAPDKKFFLDDYTRFNTMEEVMREYIAGLVVKRSKQKFHFRLLNDPVREWFDRDPLMLVDGMPVSDGDKIMAIDPLKIKKIEVVNRLYFNGSLVASGILSLSSYNGDLEGFQMDPHALILEYEGLQLRREFYSPDYDKPVPAAKRTPDLRNVLYWSPDIRITETGRKQLDFFTSDRKGKYIGVIQGITAGGKSGAGQFFFEVR
jgi:hypothetical protein